MKALRVTAAGLLLGMGAAALLVLMFQAAGYRGLLAAVILLHPWARRRHAYRLAERLHRRMPADEHEARLYEDRLEVWQAGWYNRFATAGFDRIERQGEHLILLRREGVVICSATNWIRIARQSG